MKSRLPHAIKAFGFKKGIQVYRKLKKYRHGWFEIPKSRHKVYLRPSTTDTYTFKQVFIESQYNIPLPFEPKQIIDGGANIGLAAIYFAEKYPASKIVAVEPDVRNFESILKNTQPYQNINPLNKGLWNKNTFLEIIDNSANENSYMVKEVSECTDKGLEAISIESIMKMNDWQSIDILKIDIEGSEKEVFEMNYEYWLPKTKAIFIELHDNMRQGASQSVFNTIGKYKFQSSQNHENIIFLNENWRDI